MDLTPNDGTRPSLLELGRYASGELSEAERAEVEARMDDRARAWLDEVERARNALPAVDPGALRARAAIREAPSLPRAANTVKWFGAAALLAAVFLGLVLGLSPRDPTVDPDYVGARGAEAPLRVHVFRDGALRPWSGDPVGEGDRLGFEVVATGHRGVVLLSVDGAGQVTVFWPASGDRPEPLGGEGPVRLPGSVTLDGAPGPEVFVAVYDRSPSEAASEARRRWQSGGPEALSEWAARADDVAAVVMERR